MRIREITLYRADLPLITPYKLSYNTFETFEPIIVEVRDEDGGRPLLRGALHHLGVGGDVVVHRVHRERHARARVCPADRPLPSRSFDDLIDDIRPKPADRETLGDWSG